MGFYLGAGIVFLLMLAVLELNKNTLLGFLLTIAATALFVFLRGRAAGGGHHEGRSNLQPEGQAHPCN